MSLKGPLIPGPGGDALSDEINNVTQGEFYIVEEWQNLPDSPDANDLALFDSVAGTFLTEYRGSEWWLISTLGQAQTLPVSKDGSLNSDFIATYIEGKISVSASSQQLVYDIPNQDSNTNGLVAWEAKMRVANALYIEQTADSSGYDDSGGDLDIVVGQKYENAYSAQSAGGSVAGAHLNFRHTKDGLNDRSIHVWYNDTGTESSQIFEDGQWAHGGTVTGQLSVANNVAGMDSQTGAHSEADQQFHTTDFRTVSSTWPSHRLGGYCLYTSNMSDAQTMGQSVSVRA